MVMTAIAAAHAIRWFVVDGEMDDIDAIPEDEFWIPELPILNFLSL